MVPEIWKKHVKNCEGEVNWLLETVKQVKKDFDMLQIPLEWKGEETEDYMRLFNEMEVVLKKLYHKDYALFLHLLYRIDIPEGVMKTQEGTGEDMFRNITETVLMREFMKVVWRHRYSH